MFNTLDMKTVSHFNNQRQAAGILFSQVLGNGRCHHFWHKLIGRENHLRYLPQAKSSSHQQQPRPGGVIQVPLHKIVGSEGRVQDFDAAFRPLASHVSDRWIGIAAARRQGVMMPPVDLIQVGDEYYVRDGHHRVSVAKAFGQEDIEARVMYRLVSVNSKQ